MNKYCSRFILCLCVFLIACGPPPPHRAHRLVRESRVALQEDHLVLLQWPKTLIPFNDSLALCSFFHAPAALAVYHTRTGALQHSMDLRHRCNINSLAFRYLNTDTNNAYYREHLAYREQQGEQLISVAAVQRIAPQQLLLSLDIRFPCVRYAKGRGYAPDTAFNDLKTLSFATLMQLPDLSTGPLCLLPLTDTGQGCEMAEGCYFHRRFYATRLATNDYSGPAFSVFEIPGLRRSQHQPGIRAQADDRRELDLPTFFMPCFAEQGERLFAGLRTRVYDLDNEVLVADFRELLPDLFALQSFGPVPGTSQRQWLLQYLSAADYRRDNAASKRALVDLDTRRICYRDTLHSFCFVPLDSTSILSITRDDDHYYFEKYRYE